MTIKLYFLENPKRLLLVDAVGAVLTNILLNSFVRNFNQLFGLSKSELSLLCISAVIVLFCSLSIYFLVRTSWRPIFFILGLLNLCYISITLYIIYSSASITPFGIIYLSGEIFLIAILAYFELLLSNSTKKVHNT